MPLCRTRFAVTGGAIALVCLLASTVRAAPLSVRIGDHDFTFDVPTDAVYDFAGPDADHLYVPWVSNNHYVHGYTYLGRLGTIAGGPAASPDPYPVYSGTPVGFAGNMTLHMYFGLTDGPYTNPAGDKFEVSLSGTHGSLSIYGWIATQGWPPAVLYPAGPPADIVLLAMDFHQVSLLARAGSDTADLVEGIGWIKILLGEDVSAQNLTGAAYFKFMAPVGTPVFAVPAGALYDPLVSYGWAPLEGARISGEAGAVPEPASLALMALGGAAALVARRRRGRQ